MKVMDQKTGASVVVCDRRLRSFCLCVFLHEPLSVPRKVVLLVPLGHLEDRYFPASVRFLFRSFPRRCRTALANSPPDGGRSLSTIQPSSFLSFSHFSLLSGFFGIYSFWCSINWRRDRRLIPPVCIQWNVSLLGGPQTVSLNFLPTSFIPTKFSHLFAGKSSCRRRLQMVQPYVLAKVGPGVLRALKRAPGPNHLRSRC